MTVSNISQFILLNKRNVGLSGKFPVTLAEIQGFSGKRGHSSSYLNCSLPFHVINPCNSQLSGTQLLKRMCRYLPIIPVICVPCLCRIPAVEPRVFFHVQSSSSSLHRTPSHTFQLRGVPCSANQFQHPQRRGRSHMDTPTTAPAPCHPTSWP